MPAILNLIMFLQLSCGLRYCTEFGALMANYSSMTDDMFKLARQLYRYPKMIHTLKLIFFNARRWMDTALNFVLQQNWKRIIFLSNFQYKTANMK